MRADVFVGLNVDHYPRQDFGAGEVVLNNGANTDRLLIVLKGRLADVGTGRTLGPGEVVKAIEFFGSSQYGGQLCGRAPGQVVVVPRAAVRDALNAQGSMTWNLACAISIETLASMKEHA